MPPSAPIAFPPQGAAPAQDGQCEQQAEPPYTGVCLGEVLANGIIQSMNISREDAKLSVGPGWGKLLDEVYDRLEKFPDAYVAEVKEKWGTLRIYVYGVDEDTLEFIDEIEERSGTICEVCGEPGKLRDGGWIVCRCDKHIGN